MNVIQTLAISALPIIFAITLHEAAHGYAARHFGDPTAWQMGRISLNPLRHVDLVGTLLVPGLILLLSSGGALFGWAKPVPVNFSNLRRPKQDMLWVAAAGPGANLVMALGWALLLKLVVGSPEHAYSEALKEMARVGIGINGVIVLGQRERVIARMLSEHVIRDWIAMLIEANSIEVAITVESQNGRCDLFGFDQLHIKLNWRIDSWVIG